MRTASTSFIEPGTTRPKNNQSTPNLFERVSLSWILSNLRLPSFGLSLFLIGLNATFILPFAFPGYVSEIKSPAARYSFAVASVLLAVGGICELMRHGMLYIKHQCLWKMLAFITIIFLVIHTVMEGTDIYVTLRNAGIFVLLLTVPAIGIHRENWPWLWLNFIIQALVGLPTYYYMVISGELTTRMSIFSSEVVLMVQTILSLSGFLFLMLPILQGKWLKLLAVFFFLTSLVHALLAAQRGPWLSAAFTLCIIIFVMFRIHGFHRYLGRILPKATLSYLPILILLIVGYAAIFSNATRNAVQQVVSFSYAQLESRMTGKGSVSETIMENERWTENERVMECMTFSDWIIGKGLGATWSSSDMFEGEIRTMVHNTWLNCFFWGGVPLFLVVFWPLVWALRIMFFSKSPTAMCFAGYMLITYFAFPFFLVTDIIPRWILLCVALGVCQWDLVQMRRRPMRYSAT